MSLRLAGVATLIALSSSAALAGLTQDDVNGVGGFLSAYSGTTQGANPDPGFDPETGYYGLNLNEQSFTGNGSALASSSFSESTHINSGAGIAGLGFVSFTATTESMFDFTSFSSTAVVHGGWTDTITIAAPGYTGQTAIWLFQLNANGQFAASGFVGSPRIEIEPYVDNARLSFGVPGFDPGNADPIATDIQHAEWGLTLAFIGASQTRSVNDTVTFAAEIVVGEPFELGVYALGHAGATSNSAFQTLVSTADVNVGTVSWAGSAGLSVDGVPVVGYSVTSSSGTDWMQVIAAEDFDGDGVLNDSDNCLLSANPTQLDTDADNIGNACDADLNNDCSVNFADLAELAAGFFPVNDPEADFDGDGSVNFGDLAFMKSTFFNGPNPGPGPSGLANACQ